MKNRISKENNTSQYLPLKLTGCAMLIVIEFGIVHTYTTDQLYQQGDGELRNTTQVESS